MKINKALQNAIVSKQKSKILKLIIHAYSLIKTEPLATTREDNRRNQLVAKMRAIQNSFGVNVAIGNSDEFDSSFDTIGKTDIAFIFGSFSSQKIIFECKRFKDQTEICKSYVQREYIGEGLNRFVEEKYPVEYYLAGMIAFVENGNSKKCYDSIKQELFANWNCDESAKYNHNYVGQSNHMTTGAMSFVVKHLIFDFSNDQSSA